MGVSARDRGNQVIDHAEAGCEEPKAEQAASVEGGLQGLIDTCRAGKVADDVGQQQPHRRSPEVPLRRGQAFVRALRDGAREHPDDEQQSDENHAIGPEGQLQILASGVVAESDGDDSAEVADREQSTAEDGG